MKLVFERNGKYVATSDLSGLSSEGREILAEMESNEQAGRVEYNYHLVARQDWRSPLDRPSGFVMFSALVSRGMTRNARMIKKLLDSCPQPVMVVAFDR